MPYMSVVPPFCNIAHNATCFIKVYAGLSTPWICQVPFLYLWTEENLKETVVEKEGITSGWAIANVVRTGYHKVITLVCVIQPTVAWLDVENYSVLGM